MKCTSKYIPPVPVDAFPWYHTNNYLLREYSLPFFSLNEILISYSLAERSRGRVPLRVIFRFRAVTSWEKRVSPNAVVTKPARDKSHGINSCLSRCCTR